MRKLAVFAFSFAACMLLAEYLLGAWIVVPALAAGAILIPVKIIVRTKRTSPPAAPEKVISVALLAVCLGGVWWWGYEKLFYSPAAELFDSAGVIRAEVISYPEEYSYSAGVTVRLKGVFGSPRVNLRLKETYDLKPGDVITLPAQLSEIAPDGGFDFTRYYRSKRIYLTGSQTGDIGIERADGVPLRLLHVFVNRRMSDRFDLLFEGGELGLVKALTTGNTGEVTESSMLSFSNTGLSHIISVSGLHISIIAGFVLVFFKNKRKAAIIMVALIFAFLLVTGGAASTARACIMHSIALLGVALGRDEDPLSAFAAALLILLVICPFAVTDIGLQLSFLSTLGILLFATKISVWFSDAAFRRWRKGVKLKSFIAGTLATTFSAMLLTVPVTAFYFGKVSLISPAANLLVLWFVSPALLLGLVCVAASFISMPLASVIAWVTRLLLSYIIVVPEFLTRLPYSVIYTSEPYAVLWIAAAYAVIAVWGFAKREKPRGKLCVSAALVMLVIALVFTGLSRRSGELTITVLDVGQGQSVAAFSGGGTVLIDCGGNKWNGAGNVAAEYLLAHNRGTVDLLMLTHFHADHTNGVEDLLKFIAVKAAAIPDTPAGEADIMEAYLEDAGVEVIRISENTEIPFGSAILTIFRPVAKSGENEQGICALLRTGDFEALCTGDISSASEYILVEREDLPDAELLICGHHGSANSTSALLLETITPEIAAISVGKNSYGHPTGKTLARLAEAGCEIYRTDTGGHLTVTVTGGRVK
ncbi:MAG: DNA internalization-related competence protein ComEC/Rec2 [Oscillospiraceae bacterium]|jgi:competence protein ComEC|nr:DNA internalization-related competence protein ComEC/Rec2 [Oscillospiraceae bacterium]